MDGVLIDSEPLHKQVEQEMLVELGVNLPREEHVKFAGVGKEMWTILKERYGYNRDTNEDELHALKRELYMQRLVSNPIEAIEGVHSIVRYAKEKGLALAVASSSSRQNIELVTKAIGIYNDMQVIVSGDELPQTKPNPAIFIKTGKLLNIPPQECLVIEDSGNGVKAAKGANMFCVGYRNLNSGNQDLSLADIIVDNLDEVLEIMDR